jgi:hopanoid biosynthesis associated RND transporter like protein HpnN
LPTRVTDLPPPENRISMVRWVAFAARRPRLVAVVIFAVALAALAFTFSRFSLSTSEDNLISPNLPYRQAIAKLSREFPDQSAGIVVVIDATTPEQGQQAAAALTQQLAANPALFPRVRRPQSGEFFAREGLLYEPTAVVQSDMQRLISAEPFLGPIAADPSLRGLMTSLSTAAQGVSAGQAQLTLLAKPMDALADALTQVEQGEPATFSWLDLFGGARPEARRQIIMVEAKLDYRRLEPGAQATGAIRAAARSLGLGPARGVEVKMTGSIPLSDDEFGSLADRALPITIVATAAILLMLWLAVRSARVIAAILLTMLCGLTIAAALGLLIFRTFNVISIAFIPLFVGLGIDFGIQFSVRYRADHTLVVDRKDALILAAEHMGQPLSLAALAISAGFLAFAPTDYIGVSQLGVIAGVGMLVALGLNLTLLPALLTIFGSSANPLQPAPAAIARLDAVILKRRRTVLAVAVGAALGSAASLPWLHFDFNPIHMRDPHAESVKTFFELSNDPLYAVDSLQVLRPSLAAADALAARARQLPQVAGAVTLTNLVPTDQTPKLAAIEDASNLVGLSLNPLVVSAPPTDAQVSASLKSAAAALTAAARKSPPGSGSARRLAGVLACLASGPPEFRTAASQVLMSPFAITLAQLQQALAAEPVTLQSLPPELARDWMLPDGRARVSISPRGDPNNDAVLTHFIKAVLKIAPDATGTPLGIRAGGRIVVSAFLEAGALSFVAITGLLFFVLRRVRDVAITMAPIVLTGLLTLGSCVAISQPLNFANIIALPLLFGIGVAFHIYFVMSWRAGGSHLLSSSLARAVFFSALTTATGFGSLWLSSHPGTASMGKLLMISLVWTLVSALIFQPALMGPPRHKPAATPAT